MLLCKASTNGRLRRGPRFRPELPVTKLEGDHDVFGDGSVTIVATPGHRLVISRCWLSCRRPVRCCSPGRRPLQENWDNRRVPDINSNKDQTSASMQRMADIMAREKAQLWINHDKAAT